MMARLDEICALNMGQSPNSSSYNQIGDGLPFFQGNADFGERYPTVRVWCNTPVKIAHSGDILISVRAPIGALNIAGGDCCIGRGLAALTINQQVCTREYLWYAIASRVGELNLKGTGSTFQAISKNILSETEIPLPSLDKQHYIANLLNKIDYIIFLRKQQLAKLEELVKARFIELFGDPEHNPQKFPVEKLCNLCEIGSSKRIYQNEQCSNGIPFLRVSDLSNRIDKGIETSALFIPYEKYTELYSQGLVPTPGDILVTSRGTLGKCYIIKDGDRFYFQDGMISWLSHFNYKVINQYIAYLFTLPYLQKQILSLQAGSTVAYLSISMLKRLDILLPNLQLQQQFTEFVDQANGYKLTIQQSLDKLETLKKSQMQQYFGDGGE